MTSIFSAGLLTVTDPVEESTSRLWPRGMRSRVRAGSHMLPTGNCGAVVADEIRSNGDRPDWLRAQDADASVSLGQSALAEYRLRQGLSREDAVALMRALAFESGVEVLFTVGELAECEADRRAVPAKLLDALCQVYRIPPRLLIGGHCDGGP